MKLFLAVVASVLAVGLIFAVAVPAAQQGVTPAAFSKLKKKVGKLQRQMNSVRAQLSCFTAVIPVSQYPGYLNGDPVTPMHTTALDLTQEGDTVQGWVATVDSSCVVGAKAPRLFKPLHSMR